MTGPDLARNLIQRVNVADALGRSAAARPAQVAVVDGDRSWTYSRARGIVVEAHLAITMESFSAALDSAWNSSDRFLVMMPMFHAAQLNAFCTPAVLVGATIHVSRGFEPEAFLDTIERERIAQVFGLPMMYRAALEHGSFGGRDLSSLRRAVYAMAPMPEPLTRACLDGLGCDFALLFGQTEMSPCTTLFRPEHQLSHFGAVGTPITGVRVAIMGPDGALLPPGELGEIVYRGPSTINGYLDDERATDEAFRHGWFHSGDVGRFGEDGHKVPKLVIVAEELPKTSTGKIQKNVVRQSNAAHYEGA